MNWQETLAWLSSLKSGQKSPVIHVRINTGANSMSNPTVIQGKPGTFAVQCLNPQGVVVPPTSPVTVSSADATKLTAAVHPDGTALVLTSVGGLGTVNVTAACGNITVTQAVDIVADPTVVSLRIVAAVALPVSDIITQLPTAA